MEKASAMLAVLACLLAAFITPSAHAAATYDITQVGDAKFVSVTDTNGKELSGLTTGSDAFNVKATIRLRIDDIGALREGDTVLVKATAASGSHFGPGLFTDMNLPSFLTDKQGRNVFSVKYVDLASFSLTRTGTEEQGSYICDLTVANTLWNWCRSSTSSTWRIGKSSTYTFSSQQSRNSPCTWNSGTPNPEVSNSLIGLYLYMRNCQTMTTLAKNGDTSSIGTDDQITWFHVSAETGRMAGNDLWANGYWVQIAYDENTPGATYDTRDNANYLAQDANADVSTFAKTRTDLKPGHYAIRTLSDGSLAVACNYGSRLPGRKNSLQVQNKGNGTTLKLLAKTGHIWQNAQFGVKVHFADESIPNRVKVETQSTESAYRTTTLTTKPLDPAVGAGQSAIRYDPNGGDGDAFRKAGDPGTQATTPEAATFLRKGYAFAGWNTKADGTGTAYQAGADVAYPAEGDTLTLYARWEANAYKTEFRDWRGRTITSGMARYGTTPTVPALSDTTWLADPDMNFDNVDGWRKNRVWNGSFEFTKDGLITRTRDLYGPSKKPFDGMVHIELQGDASKANGQIGVGWHEIGNSNSQAHMEWNRCEKGQADCVYDGYSTPSKDNNIETWLQIDSDNAKGYGELLAKHMQLTQVDPATHNGVARDGYVFTGWDKDPSKPVEGDTVYTARYRPAVYKVRFDANGGTGAMADQSHTYDRKQALTASAFTREGYRFTGWNTRGDGKGKAFTDKQTVTNLLAHDGAVGVLYAQWERIPETALPMAGGVIGGIPSIIGGVVTAAALALAVMARRRGGRHAV